MTKQELIQAAKEIREICCNGGKTNTWDDCKNCPFYDDKACDDWKDGGEDDRE